MLFRTRYNALFRQFRLLTAQAGSIPAAIRLIFENCYKRIFCASPIYGSADDFTSPLNFTPCKGVTPAAKQQVGETRKKCNSDDRRLRRIQGGAVGAAVSRTRVPLKARSGRWAPQPVLAKRLAFFRFDFHIGIVKGEQPLTRCGESGVQR